MAYDTGFSRRAASEREIQPVAIISVDPTSRTAVGLTKTRHDIRINCAYATGDTITVPATGEQWYVERFDMEWRLYGRIPFNDPTLNIKPEEGQVSVGSAYGPLELNGPEVRVNSKIFRLNDVYYRDNGTTLERSADKVNWAPVSSAQADDLVQSVAAALTGFQGADLSGAASALQDWGGSVQTIVDNFSEFWNLLCQNVFVGGFKDLGFGDTDVAKMIDGFQNFVNYLFSTIFCDFNGDLTPQTLLARVRDLLAPVASNPFILALQEFFTLVSGSTGSLLQDAIGGITQFIQTLFDVLFCQADPAQLQAILDATGDVFGPISIIQAIEAFFDVFRLNPFLQGLSSFLQSIAPGLFTGNLLQDAVIGGTKFLSTLFGVLTCDPNSLTTLAEFFNGTPNLTTPQGILATLAGLVTSLMSNPLITAIQSFASQYLGLTGTLLQQIITGTGSLFNWFFKALTTFLPFVPWQALLPFLDWTAINNATVSGITFPSLLTTNLFGMFDSLFTGLLGNAAGAFKNFITNLGTLFNGMGLLSGDFNLVEAVEFFLTEVLGIATRGLDGVLQFGGTIVSSVLGAVGDFFENIAAFFGFDLRDYAQGALSGVDMIVLFLDHIKDTLLDWITFFVLGGHNTILDWATTNVVNPIIGNFLAGLGIDPSKLGFASPQALLDAGVSAFANIARLLLTSATQIPANLISGFLPPGVFGTVPVSSISDVSQNLLSQGAFGDSSTVSSANGWSWDGSQSATGGGGSVKLTIGPNVSRYLYSQQAVPVSKGDRLVINATVKASLTDTVFMTSPSNAQSISISIIPFFGKNRVLDSSGNPLVVTIASIGTAARTGWTIIGNDKNSPYTVTDTTWTSVIVQLAVAGSAYQGSVWFDDINVQKTGLLVQGHVDSLNDSWNSVIGGLKNQNGPTTGLDWTNLFDAASEARGRAETGVTNAGTAQTTADGTIDGLIQGINGTTSTGNPYTAVKDAVGGLSDLTQGFTQSGVNLLADPKASYNRLWMQSGLSVSSLFYKSTSTSLRFAADGTARTFQWTINNIGNIVPITAQAGKVYYCECYVYLPDANPTTTATVTMYAQGTVLPATSYPSDISPMVTGAGFTAAGTWSYTTLTNPAKGAWNRLYGYFTVPAGRDGFTAGIRFTAAASHYVHVDDMVIYDVTESVNTNNKLYGRPTPADTIATASVPTGIPAGNILNSSGTGNIGSEVSGLSSTVSGQAGTISGLQSTTSGLTTTTTDTINNVVWGLRGVAPGTNYTTSDILTWFQQLNQTLFRTNTPTLGSTATINAATVPAGMSRDKILNLDSDLSGAVSNAGNAINGVGYLQTSLLTGYTVQTYTGSTTWTKPADLSELYVVLFGAGGTGATGGTYNGYSPPSTVAGGAGGTRGRLVATQIDLSLVSGLSSVTITIGSTASPTTSFGNIVSSAAAYANYVATPLGLMTSSSLPGNGGAGGTVDNISLVAGAGVAGDTTSTGVVGGSGGAGRDLFASGTYYGNNGSAGFNGALYANLSQSGGSGGGGGGSIRRSSSYTGLIYGGNGGSGGLPGGGGGGGGAASGGGVAYGGSGGAGGNGLVIIAYKLAKKTA